MAQTDYNDKSLDGVLGTQTQGGRMVGAEESAELWRHPIFLNEIGSLSFYKTCHWYVARSPYCERAPSSESQNGYVLDVSKSQRGGSSSYGLHQNRRITAQMSNINIITKDFQRRAGSSSFEMISLHHSSILWLGG